MSLYIRYLPPVVTFTLPNSILVPTLLIVLKYNRSNRYSAVQIHRHRTYSFGTAALYRYGLYHRKKYVRYRYLTQCIIIRGTRYRVYIVQYLNAIEQILPYALYPMCVNSGSRSPPQSQNVGHASARKLDYRV